MDALLAFGSGLGLTEADLDAYEPLAGAHAYTCYMAWLASMPQTLRLPLLT